MERGKEFSRMNAFAENSELHEYRLLSFQDSSLHNKIVKYCKRTVIITPLLDFQYSRDTSNATYNINVIFTQ